MTYSVIFVIKLTLFFYSRENKMKNNNYFKSLWDIIPGEKYYTQLEKWSFTSDWNNYRYLWEYISSRTIEKLQKNNQEEIIDILFKTYNIPVIISENKKLSLETEDLEIISEYLFSTQQQLITNFDLQAKSSRQYKYNIENQINNLAQEYIIITWNNDQQRESFSIFLATLYQLINQNLTNQINEYSWEWQHPIKSQINKIIEECKIFFCINLTSTQLSDLYIKTNIANLIENIENYFYASYYQIQESHKSIEDTEYNNILLSLQTTIQHIDNNTFEKNWDNEQNPISTKLFHNLVKYIWQIKIRPNTSQEQEKIWHDIQDIYINFIKTAHDTEDEEIIRKGILHLKKQFWDCDIILNQLINIKKYKYDDISPLSLLWLFSTLQQEYEENNYTKVLETISELQKLPTEEFQQLDKQEIKELETILRSEEVQARELLGKIKDLI